jgi:hypothetical protein
MLTDGCTLAVHGNQASVALTSPSSLRKQDTRWGLVRYRVTISSQFSGPH